MTEPAPDPRTAFPGFYQNPAIASLADSPRWTVSDKEKMPIDIRALQADGVIRGAREKTANCLMALDELAGFLPDAANCAFALNARLDGLLVLDIEKSCPVDISGALLTDLLSVSAYSEVSMSGKGYHLVLPRPDCFDDYPIAAGKTKLREEHGWYEILLEHWVTFTRHPIPHSRLPHGRLDGSDGRAAWERLYARLAETAREVALADVHISAEKPEIPGEDEALYVMTSHALPKTLADFDGDNSRFEFSTLSSLNRLLEPALPYLRQLHGSEYDDSMRAWLLYEAATRMIPHRPKHDQFRNGMPLLLNAAVCLLARRGAERGTDDPAAA